MQVCCSFILVCLSLPVVAQDTAKTQSADFSAHSNPSCKECPPPDFPPEARKAKIDSAAVWLEVTVTENGKVKDIQVLRDPGHGFAARAVAAVKNWKFKPALAKDGKPVAVRQQFEVSFRLAN